MATYQELRARSQQVRDEQNIGGNTALRVGQLLMDIVKYFYDNDAAASEYLQQHFAMVNEGTQLLKWQQSPIVLLHTMGTGYDDDDYSALSQGENYYRNGFIIEANGQGGGINGETPKVNVLYVNLANDTLYTWNGSSFDAITSGGGGGGISGDDIIKNAYYSNGNLVLVFDTENGDKTVSIPVNFDAQNYVPTRRTVNGKALSSNITLSQSDIPGLVAALAGKISGIKTSDNTPLTPDSNGVVTLPPAGSTISPATAAPSMDGAAAVGSSAKYAREDHVHPHDSSKQDKLTSSTTMMTINGDDVHYGDSVTIQGEKGEKGDKGDTLLVDGEFDPVTDIVNGLTESETGKALDAKQGKVLREKIMELDAKFQDLVSKLSSIAFSNGKPSYNAIDWSLPTYLVTLVTTGLTNASASASSLNITEGGSCIITVTPDTDKVLQSVSYSVNGGASQTATITNNQAVITIENITAATTVAISGNAAAPSVVQVTKSAKYGSITGNDTVTAGGQYQATITPNQYFGLKSGNVVVKINNVVATEGTDYTLTIDPSTYAGTLVVQTTGATQSLDISVKCAILLYKGYYNAHIDVLQDTRSAGSTPAVCAMRGRLGIGEDVNTSGKFAVDSKLNGVEMSYQHISIQFFDGTTYVTYYSVNKPALTINCNDGYIIAGGKVTDSIRCSLNADNLENCYIRYYADGDTANGTPIVLFDGTDTDSYILVE